VSGPAVLVLQRSRLEVLETIVAGQTLYSAQRH